MRALIAAPSMSLMKTQSKSIGFAAKCPLTIELIEQSLQNKIKVRSVPNLFSTSEIAVAQYAQKSVQQTYPLSQSRLFQYASHHEIRV